MPFEPSNTSIFPHTEWIELRSTMKTDEASLDRLIRLYWQPLRIYLVATFPSLQSQAETLLQDFAQDRMLKDGWLQKADPNRGRFRDFLKRSLRNFVLDHLNRTEVKNPPIPLEDVQNELPQGIGEVEEFDLAWARTVLAETLLRMEKDCKNPQASQPRRGHIWEMFRIRLLEPVFNEAEQVPYDDLISRFGLQSPTDASNLLLSAKRIFKGHLESVIREYAGQGAATAAEIESLKEFLIRLEKRG